MLLSRLLPLLAALLALASAALVGRETLSAWRSHDLVGDSLQSVQRLRLALSAAEMVSRERGPTNGVLGEALPIRPERSQALAEARARTDKAWAALELALPDLQAETPRLAAQQQLVAARNSLAQARAAVDRTSALPKDDRSPETLRDTVRQMVAVVPLLAPITSMLAGDAQQAYPALDNDVQGARLTAELREYAGLLGSHFTAALTRHQAFTASERLAIEHTRGRIAELQFLLQLHTQTPGQHAATVRAWNDVLNHYFGAATALVNRIVVAGETAGDYGLDPAGFAALYVPDMNVMFNLRDALLDQATARAQAEHLRSQNLLTIVAGASLLLLLVAASTLVLVHRRVLRPLAATTRALKALADNDQRPVALPQPVANDEIAAVMGAVRTLQAQTQDRLRLEQERDGLIERLREQSNSDFLTGLPNRRAFFAAADRELALARRHGYGVVAILFDIDNFKQFNDRLGHAAGDRALTDVARVVRHELRSGDLVARYGGEEFVMLLSHSNRTAGLQFAERLRMAIEANAVACPGDVIARVTASLGVADSASHGTQLEVLLQRADAAMYLAKQTGRNRVVVAEEMNQATLA